MTSIVAHRGLRLSHPENSLPAIHAAIEAGADAVEVDIQFSKDKVPMLFHDETLLRTTGQHGHIFDYTCEELKQLNANERERLGDASPPTVIPTLDELVGIIKQYPGVKFYIELKRHSLQHFDLPPLVQQIIDVLQEVAQQCVIISFHILALEYVRAHSRFPIGWIIRRYDDAHHQQALKLNPEILICNHIKLDVKQPLWTGAWEWMLYEINSVDEASLLIKSGIAHIETADVGLMKQLMTGAIS